MLGSTVPFLASIDLNQYGPRGWMQCDAIRCDALLFVDSPLCEVAWTLDTHAASRAEWHLPWALNRARIRIHSHPAGKFHGDARSRDGGSIKLALPSFPLT